MAIFRKVHITAPKATKRIGGMTGVEMYCFATAVAVVPAIVFLLSNFGYFDGIYAYTVGVPAKDTRSTFSMMLAFLSVNVIVARFVSVAFNDPEDIVPKAKESKKSQ
ncbi:hypothetical protein FOA52_006579 [Chlamydomonas sp. UWO 241]|nr:hypothetical protein FOA52_006579 [Chlamydomonas sp. UWO 241]